MALKRLGVIAESQERDRRVSDKEVALILEHQYRLPYGRPNLVLSPYGYAAGKVTRIRWPIERGRAHSDHPPA